MSTCKALLSKITNKNAFYEQEDVTQNICVPCGGNLHFILFVCDDSELPAYFYRGSDDFYKRLCGGMCAGVDLWIATCEDGA